MARRRGVVPDPVGDRPGPTGSAPTTTVRQRHAGLGIVVTRIPSSATTEGTDFVLVHGIGVSSRYFGPLAAELARSGTVHLVDLPGYGAAPDPRRDVPLAEHAAVLAAFLRASGIERPVLVGHSMGSQVIAAVAEQHPDAVQRIVLMAPTMPPRYRTLWRAVRELARDAFREPPAVTRIVVTDYLLRCGVPYLMRQMPHMLDDALEERMSRIAVPVLVLHGDRDPIVDADWARELAARAPDGRFEEVQGPHVVMHSSPEMVAARIVDFVHPARSRATPSPVRHLLLALADYPNAIRLRVDSLRDGRVPDAFPHGDRRPVVILPGVWEPWHYLRAIAEHLNRAGHPVHVVPGLGLNVADIPESAAIVARHLEENELSGVALVAHSKGGLIGKQLMLREDAQGRVDRMVAVATPFGGSSLARLTLLRSLRAFRPTHPVIRALIEELEVNARITSVYPEFDPHIPEGSRLDGARNVELPLVGHFRVLIDPRTADAVLGAVRREAARARPTALA